MVLSVRSKAPLWKVKTGSILRIMNQICHAVFLLIVTLCKALQPLQGKGLDKLWNSISPPWPSNNMHCTKTSLLPRRSNWPNRRSGGNCSREYPERIYPLPLASMVIRQFLSSQIHFENSSPPPGFEPWSLRWKSNMITTTSPRIQVSKK